jgi:hypothetical protein
MSYKHCIRSHLLIAKIFCHPELAEGLLFLKTKNLSLAGRQMNSNSHDMRAFGMFILGFYFLNPY